MLEKKYKWYGICIEPHPDKFKDLQRNRNSICVNNAMYNKEGKILYFNKSDMLSGISNDIDKYMEVKNTEKIKIITNTLTNVLDNYKAPEFIEYMSLDTEGSELKILEGLDFDKYIIGYIDVEHNFVEPKRTNIKNLLMSKGYEYLRENKWDDIYVHNSILIKKSLKIYKYKIKK